MSDSRTDADPRKSTPSGVSGESVVYVVPEQSIVARPNDGIDLREIWEILWRGKWIAIAMTVSFALGSVAYALAQTEWYRAEVLLAPAEERVAPALAGQLGGLAALAGVSVGGGGSGEALAVLRSRDFGRSFIEDLGLLPVFFADEWDAARERWRGDDPQKWPDIRDAIKYFHDNVLRVVEDRNTRLVTLSVDWTDPQVAAQWAEELVSRLNRKVRERALREAESNVKYLQSELAATSVVTLQQSIGRLLENEMQKLMLARGNEEFAFRVIDAAAAPKYRVRPKRRLIVMIGTALGGVLGVLAVLVAHTVRSSFE